VRAVDCLATSLPPAQTFPTLSHIVHQYFNNKADPNQRRAALLALGVVVEGCSEFMRPHMDELWPFVLSGFKDEDASVRKAACTCLGCITEWLEESCVEKHDILVPVCLRIRSMIHQLNPVSFPIAAARARP
jgi:importin-4